MENSKYNFSTFVVRSRKLSFWLQFKGFILKGTAPSRDNPSWLVFYYKNTPELLSAIEEYKQLKK
jgi:hypothetical protein